MTYYIIKLVIMLPLMAGMIYGALWLYRKYQPGLIRTDSERDLKLLETLSMGTSGKLAVVEFSGQKILLSVTRGRIEPVARSDAKNASANAPFPPAALTEADRATLGASIDGSA